MRKHDLDALMSIWAMQSGKQSLGFGRPTSDEVDRVSVNCYDTRSVLNRLLIMNSALIS